MDHKEAVRAARAAHREACKAFDLLTGKRSRAAARLAEARKLSWGGEGTVVVPMTRRKPVTAVPAVADPRLPSTRDQGGIGNEFFWVEAQPPPAVSRPAGESRGKRHPVR